MNFTNLEGLSPAELLPIGIEMGLLPRYLYKYRGPDEGTKLVFSQNTVWFSNPKNFNDPFDCQIISSTDNSRQELERFMLRTRPHLQWQPAELAVLVNIAYYNPEDWNKMVNESIRSTMDIVGVSCFSENFNNLLMWAHYANAHTGVCLKFDLLADPNFFITPLKVVYSTDYPLYNQVRGDDTFASKLLNTKSSDWAYEEEWRIIKQDGQGANYFLKPTLVEVMFGCKASEEFIEEIKKLAIDSDMQQLVYKKAEISNSHFALNFREL
jgi:hypothetical protein